MNRVRFLREGDLPTEPPPPPPLTVRLPETATAAALDNLADAIRELAAAIRAHLEPPAKINLAEDVQADTYVERAADGQG